MGDAIILPPEGGEQVILPPESAEPLWPVDLVTEVALFGKDAAKISEVCRKYNLGAEDYLQIIEDPLFKSELHNAYLALRKKGARHKAKAEIYAEESLETLRAVAKGEGGAPANARVESAKVIHKIAGLDASENRAQAGANGLTIHINLG